ncbi:MAG: class I SAM-dependent methyltransferase [Thermotaleaceae bacterium]
MYKENVWDFWAQRYEGLWVQKFSLGPTRREIIKYLKKLLKKDKSYRILDMGCGIGQLLGEIQSQFHGYRIELMGVDFSKEMIQRAKDRHSDIPYRQMDVKDIPFLKEPFDIILCTHSFPYYKDQKKALKDFKGLLKEDGYLLLAQASQNTLYDRAAMFFVKFTTGKAKYPSVKGIFSMTEELFLCEQVLCIREKFFMPSIYLFILKGIKL